MENVGAARIILDKELNAEVLTNTLKEMMKDKEKLIQMGENAKKVAINNVEDKIYAEIMKLM